MTLAGQKGVVEACPIKYCEGDDLTRGFLMRYNPISFSRDYQGGLPKGNFETRDPFAPAVYDRISYINGKQYPNCGVKGYVGRVCTVDGWLDAHDESFFKCQGEDEDLSKKKVVHCTPQEFEFYSLTGAFDKDEMRLWESKDTNEYDDAKTDAKFILGNEPGEVPRLHSQPIRRLTCDAQNEKEASTNE